MPKFLILITIIFAYIFIISQQSIYVLAQEKNPNSSEIVTISTGIITALGAIGRAVARSYFTVYNANQIEKRKNEEHQQYNVTLRKTLTQELKNFVLSLTMSKIIPILFQITKVNTMYLEERKRNFLA
jgi:hypothetical protein